MSSSSTASSPSLCTAIQEVADALARRDFEEPVAAYALVSLVPIDDLVERERINSEAIEEVYDAAVAIANHLYPGHFAQTPSDIPHSDSESSEEVPLASLFPRRRSARIAALSAPPSQTAAPPPISPIDEHPVLPPSTPETISETSPMTDVKALPSHCNKAAPVFDPENPQSLLRYLEDLEDLFKAHPTLITNEADKKRAAVKYVPMHEEEMWKG
ncbi:hypothetical protein NEOLEDRAFT_1179693, partial [Neolentinus lepideus HHB14362 ss-1]